MVFTVRQKTELKEITRETSKEVLRELTSDSKFIDTLVDKLVDKILDQVSLHIESLKKRIELLEKKVSEVEDEEKHAKAKCTHLELQTKLKQLRIYGLPEKNSTSLNQAVNNLFIEKLGLTNVQVDNCYRIGAVKEGHTRPVIVSFGNTQNRNTVFFNKKKLKGTKIAITEELFKSTYELLTYAKENLGKDKVWTFGGRVITKVDNKKFFVKNEEDVIKLMEKNQS